MGKLGSHRRIFMKFVNIFGKYVEKPYISLKYDRKNGHFA